MGNDLQEFLDRTQLFGVLKVQDINLELLKVVGDTIFYESLTWRGKDKKE